mmetsp:Transcript_2619/g.6290  ORF Transcript_2619/g.6290 Transcript_2619/m.6290 type:complete len:657 (+) Transcript_2619:174-2144(+)
MSYLNQPGGQGGYPPQSRPPQQQPPPGQGYAYQGGTPGFPPQQQQQQPYGQPMYPTQQSGYYQAPPPGAPQGYYQQPQQAYASQSFQPYASGAPPVQHMQQQPQSYAQAPKPMPTPPKTHTTQQPQRSVPPSSQPPQHSPPPSQPSPTQAKQSASFSPAVTTPELNPTELKFGNKIGEGSYSRVYSGYCRGKNVAIKVFKRATDELQDTELQSFREEVAIMSKIYHPNVVLFMGACTKGKELMIVTEHLPTDLETLFITEKRKIPLYQKLKMLKDAALGMNWLHCSDPIFIHRDLKLSNLLVDNNYKVCVCDFGLTQMKPKDVESLEYNPQGSLVYMAPEVFLGKYDEKCDIYSFAIVMWEVITQTPAFSENITLEEMRRFVRAVCDESFRPKIPDEWEESLKDLVRRCWASKATDRPSFTKIIEDLDNVLIDVALPDPSARSLWKQHFHMQEEVEWKEFRRTLEGYLTQKPEEIQWKCLEAVLADKSSNLANEKNSVVKICKFGQVCAWFGPLTSFSPPIMVKLHDTLKEKWFHGDVGAKEAEEKLQTNPKPSFLVRFSESQLGCFTVSVFSKKEKRIKHHRVNHVPGQGVYLWQQRYDSLKTLLSDRKAKAQLELDKPCGGSKYTSLFPKALKKKEKPPAPNEYVLPDMSKMGV